MHMSHKKRASTAFKSMGAAGLAAATIVSGLSFGPVAANAASEAESSMLGKMVIYAPGNWGGYGIPSANSSTIPVINHASSEAGAAARVGDWFVPAVGSIGTIRPANVPNRCATASGSDDRVWLSDCNGSVSQKWEWTRNNGALRALGYTGPYSIALGRGTSEARLTTNAEVNPRRFVKLEELAATVESVDNVAGSAVVSGTATPKAKVTVGGTTVDVRDDGKWTVAVTGLSNGVNNLTAIQTFNNSEVDRKPVQVTIVAGGTLVGVDQGPVSLVRGQSTQVPFLLQNNETRSSMVGSATVTAPEGTTFTPGQSTVAVGYRSGSTGDFRPYSRLDLKDGTRSADGRTMTFTVNTDGGNMVAGEQYRYLLNVTPDEGAAAGSGQMAFVYSGDSSKGGYRATGKTTTNLEVAQRELTAAVDSIDHAAGSAVLKGTATPGATIVVGEQSATANEDGDWSLEITGLESGPNSVLVEQKIGNDTVDSKPVTITINDAAIVGQDGPAATLERGERTKVQAQFETKGDVSRPDAQVTFTAPEGTTFAEGQNTIEGSYKKPGDDWANRSATLTGGDLSMDGKTYTYTFKPTSSTWTLPDASLLRWDIDVVTPADAAEGTSSMTTKLEGTAVEGSFNASSSTRTTIESAEAPAPAPLVVTTPANDSVVDVKRPVFSGTGDEGATIEVRGKSGRLVATTTVKDGVWSVPASFDLNDNSYALDVFQKPLQGKESQTEVRFTIATNPLTTQLTANGRFNDEDLTKPAEIFGNATTGATVTVKDSLGNTVGTAEAVDGEYVIPVPPSFAHFGVNNFTVTQTKNDVTSDQEDVSLDYGMPAPVRISSPQNGDTVAKDGLTFTGTGDEGARIDVRGNVRAIATGTVTDGRWTAPVTLDLPNAIYDLRAVQTTKGGLTTQQPITITITDRTIADLTATAAFDRDDENLPAQVSGTAEPGATVTVRDEDGEVIDTAIANGGRYTITIPPSKAHFGVNEFAVTQTVNGKVSDPLTRTLDYGTPAAPVILTPNNGATVTNGSIRFTGTGATGAKLDMRGNTSSIGDTTIVDGAWTVDVTRQLTPNVYDLHALQTSKGGLTQRSNITVTIQDEQITELTAAGTFPDDVEQEAFISGAAQTGADVVVKEGTTVIKSVKAVDGEYTVQIPATVAGERTFTVTQTVKGNTSEPKTVTLDYGTPAALVVESPTDGSTVPADQVVFTGTGQPGGKVTLGGTVSRLGEANVNAQGNWTITVQRTLVPMDYALYTKQITDGNLIGADDVRTITVTQ